MTRMITIRAIGRDFTGPAADLSAWNQARAYALAYLAETGHEQAKLFQVDPTGTCMPITLETVKAR